MTDTKFKAGDVVRYPNGRLDYLVLVPGNGRDEDTLGVNACNPAWIDRQDRFFCQEVYPFTHDDMEECVVVGHYGSGTVGDACNWYKHNKDQYR